MYYSKHPKSMKPSRQHHAQRPRSVNAHNKCEANRKAYSVLVIMAAVFALHCSSAADPQLADCDAVAVIPRGMPLSPTVPEFITNTVEAVDIRQLALTNALDVLLAAYERDHPQGSRVICIITDSDAMARSKLVTMTIRHASLGVALQTLASASELYFTVMPQTPCVLLSKRPVNLPQTQIKAIAASTLVQMGFSDPRGDSSLGEWFRVRGVDMTEGVALYIPATKAVLLENKRTELALMESLLVLIERGVSIPAKSPAAGVTTRPAPNDLTR